MKFFLALLVAAGLASAAETNQFPNRPALTIQADYSVFNLRSNVFLYTNNVRVIDPPTKLGEPPTILTCRWAVARMGPNRKLESVFAHDSVAIDQGDKQARGALAVYTATNELMTLTGPFDPNDTNNPLPFLASPQGTNYGTKIIYDRANDQLLIEQPKTIIPQGTVSGERDKTNSPASDKPSRTGGLFPAK